MRYLLQSIYHMIIIGIIIKYEDGTKKFESASEIYKQEIFEKK